MKVTTVYPSVVMRISCPYCEAEGKVRKEKPPQGDFTVVCPRCKEKFLIKINVRNFYRKTVSIPVYYSPYDIHRPDDQRFCFHYPHGKNCSRCREKLPELSRKIMVIPL